MDPRKDHVTFNIFESVIVNFHDWGEGLPIFMQFHLLWMKASHKNREFWRVCLLSHHWGGAISHIMFLVSLSSSFYIVLHHHPLLPLINIKDQGQEIKRPNCGQDKHQTVSTKPPRPHHDQRYQNGALTFSGSVVICVSYEGQTFYGRSCWNFIDDSKMPLCLEITEFLSISQIPFIFYLFLCYL